PPVPGDPTSSQQAEQLPTYNAYSADGDVTAPLVYVNYGIPADYEQLDRMRVSVKGAIVIARYGASWRGIKPKVAAEHGAVGCLIFSDPRDDGYAQGDVYPQGPWRPMDGVQRGSVMDMPVYPGDPLTPGVGATKDAKRLSLQQAQTNTKIPVLPISYADAQPLLAALGGRTAPDGWRGGLGITYHVGPGPAKVHLRVKSDWGTKTLYDVIARIPGSAEPDAWIIRGNHHDAWVNGAQDPLSGQAPLLEEARALADAHTPDAREEARRRADLRISALGSGSDFTPFLQHAGIASLNLGYGGEGGGGVYHSIYDDFKWYTTFDDTSFVYGRALAQTVGTAVMRLADAELLPYEFGDFAETVGGSVPELQKLLKDKQDEVKERNRQIDEGVFSATDDPREPLAPPVKEEVPP